MTTNKINGALGNNVVLHRQFIIILPLYALNNKNTPVASRAKHVILSVLNGTRWMVFIVDWLVETSLKLLIVVACHIYQIDDVAYQNLSIEFRKLMKIRQYM